MQKKEKKLFTLVFLTEFFPSFLNIELCIFIFHWVPQIRYMCKYICIYLYIFSKNIVCFYICQLILSFKLLPLLVSFILISSCFMFYTLYFQSFLCIYFKNSVYFTLKILHYFVFFFKTFRCGGHSKTISKISFFSVIWSFPFSHNARSLYKQN